MVKGIKWWKNEYRQVYKNYMGINWCVFINSAIDFYNNNNWNDDIMTKEWNILVLETMLKDESISPLRKYYVWEMLKKLKEE